MVVVVPVGILSWRTVCALSVAWIVYQVVRMLYNVSPLGSIVRINPGELHCNDPNFGDDIYYAINRRKRNRHAHQLKNLRAPHRSPAPSTTTSTAGAAAAMDKFFSRLQMLKFESKVHALAQRLCDKLDYLLNDCN
ncbi:hypothetical protein CTA1_2790 [Colletotrichum tanaceti]|uniref:Uncharacterized protein n=1 Tax=Colletotrichum tanaceti TaxID=1306861 RepID=A0A4U6X262_9PEZI|nr:hypothetical protein CTA1_2790 [Colletotrichum tanaceti]